MFGLVDVVSMSILDGFALFFYIQSMVMFFVVGRALRAMPALGLCVISIICFVFPMAPPVLWTHFGMNEFIVGFLYFVIMTIGFYTAHREIQGSKRDS